MALTYILGLLEADEVDEVAVFCLEGVLFECELGLWEEF